MATSGVVIATVVTRAKPRSRGGGGSCPGDVRLHPREQDRLESLRSYGVLDTLPEAPYDHAARLAATLCDAPVGLVSLVDDDRQWWKAAHGIDAAGGGTCRAESFCSDAVAAGAPLLVADALADPRYARKKLVTGPPGIRAYAGVPLAGRDGLPLGTLCVVDFRPRSFTSTQVTDLLALADGVAAHLELRRADLGLGREPPAPLAAAVGPGRLWTALDAGELVCYYQPIVALDGGATVGLEALIRWEHPDLGCLPPAVFLPVVETSGLAVPVGRHVLDTTLGFAAGLRRSLPRPPKVGVNVSGAELRRPGLASSVLTALRLHGLEPSALTVELTETVAYDPVVAASELGCLRAEGVGLALDDYGSGKATLEELLGLPVTTMKLDRGLVAGVPGDRRSVAAVRSSIRLASQVGVDVVAEGVETLGQAAWLRSAGAGHAQGWLFGRPVPADRAVERLAGEAVRSEPPVPARGASGAGGLADGARCG